MCIRDRARGVERKNILLGTVRLKMGAINHRRPESLIPEHSAALQAVWTCNEFDGGSQTGGSGGDVMRDVKRPIQGLKLAAMDGISPRNIEMGGLGLIDLRALIGFIIVAIVAN
ncbi:hypothetical protein OQ645_25515, partial [Klebsiella pneumoniae]|nr:hypothetical protein [Klebsiella pneumoniae]